MQIKIEENKTKEKSYLRRSKRLLNLMFVQWLHFHWQRNSPNVGQIKLVNLIMK